VQAGFIAWGADYPSASNVLAPQFSCSTAPPASQSSMNAAELCSPRLDKAVDRALSVQITDKAASANARWAAIDRMVTDIAPWAPIVNGAERRVRFRGVGNVQANQALGVLLHQIWVK
jgi:ABC-type oligopeptide transport system substrate-binding subunit